MSGDDSFLTEGHPPLTALLEFTSVFFVYKCHLANQALAELFYEGLGWKLQEDVFFCAYVETSKLVLPGRTSWWLRR